MALNKRIGIMIGRIYKGIHKELIDGIMEQAALQGFSAYIFTLNEECHNPKIIHGEENLFNMINFSKLDGIIFAPYTFASVGFYNYIESFLRKNCPLPVIRIGSEIDRFIPLWHDDRSEMAEIVLHLIYGHSCKNIICLTGPEELGVSHNRAEGYRDALEKAGLPYSEGNVIFGDFWTESAKLLAEEIAGGKRLMPDAVACANDIMAISLCDALEEKGIIVPDDIKVTGYDGYTEARFHSPAITTYNYSQKQLGREAMCLLYKHMTGQGMHPCGHDSGKLLCRESCGCRSKKEQFNANEVDFRKLELSLTDTTLSSYLYDAKSLNEYLGKAELLLPLFMDEHRAVHERFHLALCSDWNLSVPDKESTKYRTEGYSDKMLLVGKDKETVEFPLTDMLPSHLESEEMRLTIFSAVHFMDRCFGYAAFQTDGSVEDFNLDYVRFLREFINGLYFLCVQNEMERLAYRNYISQRRDELTGLYIFEKCADMVDEILKAAASASNSLYIMVIHIGGIKEIEDAEGALESDKCMVTAAEVLSRECSGNERLFISDEHCFILIGHGTEPESCADAYRERVSEYTRKNGLISESKHIVYLKTKVLCIAADGIPSADELFDSVRALQKDLQGSASSMSEKLNLRKLNELRKEIFLYPGKKWNGDECSARLNLSKSYFHKLYNKVFGVSFMRDVQRIRFSYAKELLQTTNDTLTSVAEKCGYDYSHFMRLFKQEFGITPTQYRKKHR